jgi:hypothetical protein
MRCHSERALASEESLAQSKMRAISGRDSSALALPAAMGGGGALGDAPQNDTFKENEPCSITVGLGVLYVAT